MPKTGEALEQQELLLIAGASVDWYKHHAKQFAFKPTFEDALAL